MKDFEPIPLKGCVFDIKRYAIHDGPGIRLNVFLKGCPLQCRWCHNPEGQDPDPVVMFNQSRCISCNLCQDYTNPSDCPSGALELCGKYMSVQEVLDLALREKVFFDRSGGGVTFTGGEPLMQPDFLIALLQACQQHDIHTTIDTCLYAPESVLKQVIPHTDLFLADLKIMDSAQHLKYTDTDNRLILTNLLTIARSGVPFALRIPLLKDVNDTKAEVEAMQAFALELNSLGNLTGVHLLPYHDYGKAKKSRIYKGIVPKMGDFAPPSSRKIKQLLDSWHALGFHAIQGG